MHTISAYGPRVRALPSLVPTLTATLLVAEVFYKFHSFTLEFLASIATWYSLDRLVAHFSAPLRLPLSELAWSLSRLRGRSLPPLIASLGGTLVIAELFYKFHSFMLEFLAAVVTWYALHRLLSRVPGIRDASRSRPRVE